MFATTSYFLERLGFGSSRICRRWLPTCPRSRSWRPSCASWRGAGGGRGAEPVRAGHRRDAKLRRRSPPAEGARRRRRGLPPGLRELISEGRVEVNGRVVVEQGLRVDPERDVVRVDGSRIPPPRRHLYLVLNKPRAWSRRWTIRGPAHLADLGGRWQPAVGQRPAVPRRPAGHRDRGPADPDQRRRLRPPARPSLLSRCRRPIWPRSRAW